MTLTQSADLAAFAVMFARLSPASSPGTIGRNVATLWRLGREASAWATRLCNSGEPIEGESDDRKRDKISKRAIKALANMGISAVWERTRDGNRTRDAAIVIEGDPRGSCLTVHVRPMGAYRGMVDVEFRF